MTVRASWKPNTQRSIFIFFSTVSFQNILRMKCTWQSVISLFKYNYPSPSRGPKQTQTLNWLLPSQTALDHTASSAVYNVQHLRPFHTDCPIILYHSSTTLHHSCKTLLTSLFKTSLALICILVCCKSGWGKFRILKWISFKLFLHGYEVRFSYRIVSQTMP